MNWHSRSRTNDYFRSTMINDIASQIEKPTGIKKVQLLAQTVCENKVSLRELIDLTFHQQEQIGFRASWILENIYTANPLAFSPNTIYFLDRFSKQTNPSARRHFAKILALITKKNGPDPIKSQLTNYDTNELVETAFAWLIDERVAVAVKSHCLNILANLVPKHPWIKEELTETMEHLAALESVAFFGKVKQIRKQLKRR